MPESLRVKRSNTAHAHGTCSNRTDGNGRQPGRHGIMRKNDHVICTHTLSASSRTFHMLEFPRPLLGVYNTGANLPAVGCPTQRQRRSAHHVGRRETDETVRARPRHSLKGDDGVIPSSWFLDVTRYSFGRQWRPPDATIGATTEPRRWSFARALCKLSFGRDGRTRRTLLTLTYDHSTTMITSGQRGGYDGGGGGERYKNRRKRHDNWHTTLLFTEITRTLRYGYLPFFHTRVPTYTSYART